MMEIHDSRPVEYRWHIMMTNGHWKGLRPLEKKGYGMEVHEVEFKTNRRVRDLKHDFTGKYTK